MVLLQWCVSEKHKTKISLCVWWQCWYLVQTISQGSNSNYCDTSKEHRLHFSFYYSNCIILVHTVLFLWDLYQLGLILTAIRGQQHFSHMLARHHTLTTWHYHTATHRWSPMEKSSSESLHWHYDMQQAHLTTTITSRRNTIGPSQ